MIRLVHIAVSCLILFSCKKEKIKTDMPEAYRVTKTISYNNIEVDVVIDKPALRDLDVLLVFHGTVQSDTNIMSAANTTLDKFKEILDRQDMMLISVAHPQLSVLFGDNILQAEAALLWLKTKANQELGINVKKIFLGGHSQGGYLVTRLNTMYPTNGVIANAPGPLNLIFRCQLEENGQVPTSYICDTLRETYGTTAVNPSAYFQRSLLYFTSGFKSDILFVQGMSDAPIQLYSWPVFKEAVSNCTNCMGYQFFEVQGGGHGSLFESPDAKIAFNQFINSH